MKEPPQYERELLENMPVGELVGIIMRQQEWAQQIYEEIERLKAVNNRSRGSYRIRVKTCKIGLKALPRGALRS